MKNNIDDNNGWIYRRICMYVCMETMEEAENQGAQPNVGVPEDLTRLAGNSRRGYWFTTYIVAINMAMTKERLISSGFYDLATAYQFVHVNS